MLKKLFKQKADPEIKDATIGEGLLYIFGATSFGAVGTWSALYFATKYGFLTP